MLRAQPALTGGTSKPCRQQSRTEDHKQSGVTPWEGREIDRVGSYVSELEVSRGPSPDCAAEAKTAISGASSRTLTRHPAV